jgi:hypothetical protein
MPRCHVPVPNHLDTVLETELGDERERRELKKSIFALRARSHLVLNEKKQKSKI